MNDFIGEIRCTQDGKPMTLVLEYHNYMAEWFPDWDDDDYLDDQGNLVSQEEYESRRGVARQVANLTKRYGFIPKHIRDYWVR